MGQMAAMSRGMAAMNSSFTAELASAQSQINVLATTVRAQAVLLAQAQSALIEQNGSTVAAIAAQNLALRNDLSPAGAAATRAAFCAAWSPAITALSGSTESTCDL